MEGFPRTVEGNNSGDGSPLVVNDEDIIGDLFCPSTTNHFIDWDGDGKLELVCSGASQHGDIYAFKLVGKLPDGTPIVDRGKRWGVISRAPQRNERDKGLNGNIAAAADFDGDGRLDIILLPRGYSQKPTVVMSIEGGAPLKREAGLPLTIKGSDEDTKGWGWGRTATIDWDGDGRPDLIVLKGRSEGRFYGPDKSPICPEDQRDRYYKDGRWKGQFATPELHLYRNTSTPGKFEFTYIGVSPVETPFQTMHISAVDPTDPKAGLLALGYYGEVSHIPLKKTGKKPVWGEPAELFTMHNEPFNRSVALEGHIGVSDVLEPGRFDIFACDKSCAVVWFQYCGLDDNGHPVYRVPRKLKQRNPFVYGGMFNSVTVDDWRGIGMQDLVVGTLEGYILWYKTLSTNPLKFSLPERLRLGQTEIRRLAMANPSAGYHWGGSQGPQDGDTGGYADPVFTDWDGDGLLDLVVSDMLSLYDWYPNRGTKNKPRLGPPHRLHLANGKPLFGPWRQQPGIADFDGDGLPDIVIQDLDLDLALFRRAGRDDLTSLLPGEKLRYEDGETIKTHGVYTPPGGDGRGRTKINVVDWDHDGKLDLILGVGPQHGSPYRGGYVLFARNVGTNLKPVFKRPIILLFDEDGAPLEFWRHGVHMCPVDWDGDGKYELLAGADQGYVWYWKPEHFGKPKNGDPTPPVRPPGEVGLGKD